jgi:hypothetical protein
MAVVDKAIGEITTLPDGKSFFYVRGSTNFFILANGLGRGELFKLQKQILKNTSGSSNKAAQSSEIPAARWSFLEKLLRTPVSYAAAAKCLSSQDVLQRIQSNGQEEFSLSKCANEATLNAVSRPISALIRVLTVGSEQILCGGASAISSFTGADVSWRRCGEYAVAMQNTVDTTLMAIGDAKQIVGDFAQDFWELPPAVKGQITCEVLGSIATGTGVTFLTFGAGAPATMSRMSQLLLELAARPGMGRTAATIKRIAANLELRAKAKTAALANVKALPSQVADIKESIAKIEQGNRELAANGRQLVDAAIKVDVKTREVDNNLSRFAAQDKLQHVEARLETILRAGQSTDIEDKALATYFLKYAKLTDSERELATKILNTERPDSAIHEKDSDIVKLAKAVRNKRMLGNLGVRDDIDYANPEDFARKATEQGALIFQRTKALNAYKKSEEKVAAEVNRYLEIVDKKNISVEDKNLYRSQVSMYMASVLCNTANSANEAVQKNNLVQ